MHLIVLSCAFVKCVGPSLVEKQVDRKEQIWNQLNGVMAIQQQNNLEWKELKSLTCKQPTGSFGWNLILYFYLRAKNGLIFFYFKLLLFYNKFSETDLI